MECLADGSTMSLMEKTMIKQIEALTEEQELELEKIQREQEHYDKA